MGNCFQASGATRNNQKKEEEVPATKEDTRRATKNNKKSKETSATTNSSVHERISLTEAGDRDIYDYYEKVEHIAEGSTCQIWTVRKKRPSSQLYVLKIISKSRVDGAYLKEMRNEIAILRTLDHPNIIRVYETFESKRYIYLVMEYCSGGDLFSRKPPYSEAQAAMILTKILSGVAYMHKNKVVHRDLKPENVIFENDSADAEPKIIDFGLSKQHITSLDNVKMHCRVGSIFTMSPQVLKGKYTSKADIWSVGAIAYVLLSGTEPFDGATDKEIAQKILKGKYSFKGKEWQSVSQQAKDFCAKLLTYNPDQRPTAAQALRDPWLCRTFPLEERRPDEKVMTSVQNALLLSAQDSKFKKLVTMMIAYKSSNTNESFQELRRAFDAIDADNSGTITYWEFRNALKHCNYDDQDLKRIFRDIDMNQTGVINYTEFLAATLETLGRIEDECIAEAFERIDEDQSGYISKENLCAILGAECSSTAENCDAMVNEILQEVDADKDGRISYDDFLILFREKHRAGVEDMCCKMVEASEEKKSG